MPTSHLNVGTFFNVAANIIRMQDGMNDKLIRQTDSCNDRVKKSKLSTLPHLSRMSFDDYLRGEE